MIETIKERLFEKAVLFGLFLLVCAARCRAQGFDIKVVEYDSITEVSENCEIGWMGVRPIMIMIRDRASKSEGETNAHRIPEGMADFDLWRNTGIEHANRHRPAHIHNNRRTRRRQLLFSWPCPIQQVCPAERGGLPGNQQPVCEQNTTVWA